MDRCFSVSTPEQSIPCRLTLPATGPVQRIVLGVHGLTGSSIDPIQTAIAQEMELFHAATYRFDFPGHGAHPSGSEGFTLQGCRDALLAVAQAAKAQHPEADLCVFATGFGAYVTLLCLEELQAMGGSLKLVVQTPSVLMHDTLLSMLQTSRETLRAMGSVTLPTPRPLTLTWQFFRECTRNIALVAHEVPMLILHSEENAYIRKTDIQQFRRINERSRLVILPGTSHRFLEEGAWDMVLDLTRDWFAFEQILLTDWE